MKKCLDLIKKNEYILISLFLYFFIIFIGKRLMFLNSSTFLTSFKSHIISQATINGYDVERKIQTFYFYVFSIALGTYILNFLFNSLYKQNLNRELYLFINEVSILGLSNVILSYLMAKQDLSIIYMGIIVIISLILGYLIKDNYINISESFIEWSCLLCFPIIIFINTVFSLKNDILSNIIILLFIIICSVICKNILDKRCFDKPEGFTEYLFIKATLPLIITIFVQSLIIELSNILSTRGIIEISNLRSIYCALIILSIIIGILYVKYDKITNIKINYKEKNKNLLEKRGYIFVLVGILCVIAQPNSKIVPWREWFETANHGLGLDELFRYGKIPVVESFDSHMFLNQIWGILYSILNGYEPWAPMLYNNYWMVIYNILSYYCFAPIFGTRFTFLVLLILPVNIIPQSFILVTLPLLYLYRKINGNSSNYFIFWLLVGIVCLLSLDLGIVAFLSSTIAYLILESLNENIKIRNIILKFITSALITLGIAGTVFIILCLIKKINPLVRIREFITVSLSNQNWAYTILGDTTTVAFNLWYYIIPILVLVSAILFLKKVISNNKNTNLYIIIAFVYFIVAYYVNFSRGIVRHSLAENQLVQVSYYFSLGLLVFVALKKHYYRIIDINIAIIILVILCNINNIKLPINSSLIEHLRSNIINKERYDNRLALNESRVEGNIINNQDAQTLKEILDLILDKDETYIDMTSLNYFYALVERPNPVYVNQSPLLLNGDFTQETFIDQSLNANAPIALIPIEGEGSWMEIDGVNVLDKYYLVTQFIYNNYEPFYKLNTFEIWGEKSRIQEFKNILKNKSVPIFNLSESRNNVQVNNGTISYINNELIFNPTGQDSHIWNILSIPMNNNKNNNCLIELQINASNVGDIQIFYSTPIMPSFIEEKSFWYVVDQPGESIINFKINENITDLRIDTDNISQLIIKNIHIYQESLSRGEEIEKEDAINVLRSHNQGWVPWLWGQEAEYELINANLLLEELDENIVLNLVSRDRAGKFLTLRINSPEEQMLTLTLRNKEKSYQEQYYTMYLKAGDWDYKLQLGSIYGYYLGKLDTIVFNPEKNKIVVSNYRMEM